jgi:FkbM family methyltransferase
MSFLLHYLRPGDLFVDIGANIGSYTVLASGAAGSDSICFEPMPSTFESLIDNLNLNRLLPPRVVPFNAAVGAKGGSALMVADQDTMNHIIRGSDYVGKTVEVPVLTLDGVLQSENQKVPAMLKIDVEGFEADVLTGAENTIKSPDLEVILIELNGCGAAFGYDDRDINQSLTDCGFKLVKYDGLTRLLRPIVFGMHRDNALYVRDIDRVQERVIQSKRFKVAGVDI